LATLNKTPGTLCHMSSKFEVSVNLESSPGEGRLAQKIAADTNCGIRIFPSVLTGVNGAVCL